MSTYNLVGGFAKPQRGCQKKNAMAQSHHFTQIATRREKVSKKRSKLFATLNRNIHNTRDENRNIMISYRKL